MNIINQIPDYASKSTKNQIINVLSASWPQNAKQIFNDLKKLGNNVTYQAVHKSLTELQDNNVLTQNYNGYTINTQWVINSKKFFTNLESNYLQKNEYKIKPDFGEPIKLEFNDASTFATKMAEIYTSGLLINDPNEIGLGLLRHAWWPLDFKFADFKLLPKITKVSKPYILIQENTPFDQWIIKYYQKAGWKVKTGIKELELEEDLTLFKDLLIRVKYSEETKTLIDKVYQRNANLTDIFQEYASKEIKKHPAKIQVTIERNPSIVKIMKENIMKKYFGEEPE